MFSKIEIIALHFSVITIELLMMKYEMMIAAMTLTLQFLDWSINTIAIQQMKIFILSNSRKLSCTTPFSVEWFTCRICTYCLWQCQCWIFDNKSTSSIILDEKLDQFLVSETSCYSQPVTNAHATCTQFPNIAKNNKKCAKIKIWKVYENISNNHVIKKKSLERA